MAKIERRELMDTEWQALCAPLPYICTKDLIKLRRIIYEELERRGAWVE